MINLTKELLVRKQRKSLAAFDHNVSMLALVPTYLNYGWRERREKKNRHRKRF